MSVLAAYPKSVKVLTRILKRHGELSSDEFDRIFGDSYKETVKIPYELNGIMLRVGDTVIRKKKLKFREINMVSNYFIGGIFEVGDWSKWLDLLQNMAINGLVEIDDKDGKIIYRLAK